jgi:transposase
MVILHDIKGLTHDEIAAQTGVTANTSKSTLSRARRKLRDALTGANTGFYEQERSCNAPSAQLSAPYGEETSVMDVPFGVNIAHTPEVANFVNGLYAGKFASSG